MKTTDTKIETKEPKYLRNKNFYFLDFESNKNGDIYLAGLYNQGNFEVFVFDPRLQTLAKEKKFTFVNIQEFVSNLLSIIKKTNGVLISYSSAEEKIIKANLPSCMELEPKKIEYLNLLKPAKKWINKFHKQSYSLLPPLRKKFNSFQQKRLKRSLASIMRLINYPIPVDYAPLGTTKRINDILSGLNRSRGDFKKLTPCQKQKCTKLIKHNFFDVIAMTFLLKDILEKEPKLISNSITYL